MSIARRSATAGPFPISHLSAACKLLQNVGMPLIQVRDVPEHIYRRLVDAAARERRSLAQQVVAVLAQGLDVEVDAKSRRSKLLESRLVINAERTNQLTDPVRLVREDRQR
jgi:hypothetical protein